MRSRFAVPAAVLAAAALASPGASAAPKPKPKPIHGTYPVLIPLPHPVEGSGGTHCTDGVDPLTRNARAMKLPAYAGKLDVVVNGFVGDWVVEIYDAQGRVLATGATLDLTSGERRATYKKKRAVAETVTIAVCNFGGTPSGQVGWTFMSS